jgi:methionine-rich copper-binding protein CopC
MKLLTLTLTEKISGFRFMKLPVIALLSILLMAGCKKDKNSDPIPQNPAIPTVLSTSPVNNATGIAVSKVITVTFSEAMNPATISASTFTLRLATLSIAGTVAYSGTTATFTPNAALSVNSVYTATITTGAKDAGGQALATNFAWSFTTAPTTTAAATIVSTTPANNATGIATNSTVDISFSAAMDPTTLTNTTVTLKQGTTSVAGTVSYTGTTATFTPANILTAATAYTATVTTGVKDAAGNALASAMVWSFTTAGGTASTLAAVNLGTSINYVILAKTEITNVPTSAITGDLGLSPAAASFITGFALTASTGYATSSQVTGKVYAADMASPTPTNLTTAVGDMMTAYTDAAGRPTPNYVELYTGNIGGQTLLPGLYKWTNTVTIPSAVTISGSATDVWIFQIAGDLTQSSAVNITLSGGAQAKNIFWQVAGQVSIGTTAHFEGIILSKTAITLGAGASMNGRALAQTSVILSSNTIVQK